VLLNKAALAEALGFSERALTDWQDDGMPILRAGGSRGEANEYDTAAVVAWLLARERRRASADNPRDDLYRSEKRLKDLIIAEKERKLVNAEEVEQAYTRMVVNARQRLLQLPAFMHGRLPPEALAQLEEAIHGALAELANYDPEKEDAGA
jgi:phage terminase Nu1 subunit (DNA packaging protein)